MLKVMTLVGTRPELIKMSRVIAELDAQVDHVLVHSGQNYDYELNQVFFDDLQIRKPDYFLGAAGDTAAKTIGDVIIKSDEIFEQEKPDALLLYGDTNTCLAVIAAKRRKIPVFHMEAGNRCFDQRVPEELNRKVLDHLSDINMVLTEHARRYLIAEGIRPETIIKTGSHMQEVLAYYMDDIQKSDVLAREGLTEDKFFLVSVHREENVDTPQNLRDLLDTLRHLADTYEYPIIVSTHPRTRKRLEAVGDALDHPLIRFVKPFGLLDYISLIGEAEERCDRPEGFLAGDRHVLGDVGENGGFIERAAERMGLAALDDARALGNRVRDVLLDLGERRLVDQRSEDDALVEAVTGLELGDCRGEFGRKGFIGTVLDVDAVGAHAGLAVVAVLGDQRALDGGIEIGIIEDDERSIAAKLETELLDGRGTLAIELGADFGRTGEGQLAHGRVRGHFRADLAGRTGDDAE